MLESEVPQETNKTLGGVKKAMYATDANGSYVVTASAGWSAEEIATNVAIDEFNALTDEAFKNFQSGKASPLEYLMYRHRMDFPTLKSVVKMFGWQIKRHFRPSVFASLNDKTLKKYADAFDINIDELKNLKGK